MLKYIQDHSCIEGERWVINREKSKRVFSDEFCEQNKALKKDRQ